MALALAAYAHAIVTPSGAIIIFQGPLGEKEKVVIGTVLLDELVALAHGQPGVLDPGIIGIELGGAGISAGLAVICIVR